MEGLAKSKNVIPYLYAYNMESTQNSQKMSALGQYHTLKGDMQQFFTELTKK